MNTHPPVYHFFQTRCAGYIKVIQRVLMYSTSLPAFRSRASAPSHGLHGGHLNTPGTQKGEAFDGNILTSTQRPLISEDNVHICAKQNTLNYSYLQKGRAVRKFYVPTFDTYMSSREFRSRPIQASKAAPALEGNQVHVLDNL